MKDFIESIIATGNYVLSEMEERIQKMYVMGKLTEEDMTYLLNLAANSADDSLQIDIVAKLAELEARIAKIESAGVVAWKSGMSTAKALPASLNNDCHPIHLSHFLQMTHL